MVVIRVRLTVKPESSDALLAHMQAEVQRNSELDGCEAYALYQNAFDTNAFLLYEEWRDVEAFNSYKTSEAFGQIMSALSPLMAGKPDSAYYDSTLVGP